MNLHSFVIPVVIGFVFVFALAKGVNVFDEFIKGASRGIKTTADILPALVAIFTAVGMLRACGAMEAFTSAIAPATALFGVPAEVVPLALLRPVSGSGAIVLVEDLLKTHGADSLIGRIASVMMGSTETTFYTIAVYYGAAQIKNSRYTLPCAFVTDAVSFIMSVTATRIFFAE